MSAARAVQYHPPHALTPGESSCANSPPSRSRSPCSDNLPSRSVSIRVGSARPFSIGEISPIEKGLADPTRIDTLREGRLSEHGERERDGGELAHEDSPGVRACGGWYCTARAALIRTGQMNAAEPAIIRLSAVYYGGTPRALQKGLKQTL